MLMSCHRWVDTDMGAAGGRKPPLTPQASVSGMLEVIMERNAEHNGKLIDYTGKVLPW